MHCKWVSFWQTRPIFNLWWLKMYNKGTIIIVLIELWLPNLCYFCNIDCITFGDLNTRTDVVGYQLCLLVAYTHLLFKFNEVNKSHFIECFDFYLWIHMYRKFWNMLLMSFNELLPFCFAVHRKGTKLLLSLSLCTVLHVVDCFYNNTYLCSLVCVT